MWCYSHDIFFWGGDEAWDEISSETIVICWKHTELIKSEEFIQKQNTATLQELQNEIHKLTYIEQPLWATEYIIIDKSVSILEYLTIDEIIVDQNQNSDSSDS